MPKTSANGASSTATIGRTRRGIASDGSQYPLAPLCGPFPMGDPSGFLKIHRVDMPERDPRERVGDHAEIFGVLPEAELNRQGARCMDCGVPFCHDGCPLGNLIPDWNDLVYRDRWREAIDQLHATNNFPEFTGLICPAPCESACVLAINDDP